jgi:hypothetical protein
MILEVDAGCLALLAAEAAVAAFSSVDYRCQEAES